MRHTARNAAVQALLQVEENEGYSNLVLDKVLKAFQLERRDSALTSILFYGVLEKRITLDFYLQHCLKAPEKKMNAAVEMTLRCAAYQILFLDKLPDSAVVNEAVETVKELGKTSSAGFVNAVLRTLLRRKKEIILPTGNDPVSLSVRYSVPASLISFWQEAYGAEDTERILKAFLERAPLYIRSNPLKASFQKLQSSFSDRGIDLKPCGFPECAGILSDCGAPQSLPQFEQGLFHVQDISAQLICEILNPQPGETVCDCCAAPGGKTFTAAEMMQNKGKLIAFDLYRGRVGLIRDGAQRLGLDIVTARRNDALLGFPDLEPVDRMLCDVPCSGYGVIRRKPEIRYKDVSSVSELPTIQYGILQNASKVVKSGGVLVYSTCTLNPAENNLVAERFLKENDGFIPMNIELPASIQRRSKEPDHMFTMMPFSGASDGFFAAAFRKK